MVYFNHSVFYSIVTIFGVFNKDSVLSENWLFWGLFFVLVSLVIESVY